VKSRFGVRGAKGIGEAVAAALPPSIVSAIFNATGKLILKYPVDSETLWRCFERQEYCIDINGDKGE